MTGTAIHHQQNRDAWRNLAACLGADPDLFYSFDTAEQDQAREICRACHVRQTCLTAANAEEHGTGARWGIRGGMTGDERARAHRAEVQRRADARRREQAAQDTTPKPSRPHRVNNGQPLPKPLRDRIESMIRDGWTNKAIVAEFDINPSTVSAYRKRLGIPSPYVSRAAECGTRSAYQRHVKRGEPIDDACRQANTDADNRLRRTGTTKQTTRTTKEAA